MGGAGSAPEGRVLRVERFEPIAGFLGGRISRGSACSGVLCHPGSVLGPRIRRLGQCLDPVDRRCQLSKLNPDAQCHVVARLLGEESNERGANRWMTLETSLNKLLHHPVRLKSDPNAPHHIIHLVDLASELHHVLADVMNPRVHDDHLLREENEGLFLGDVKLSEPR